MAIPKIIHYCWFGGARSSPDMRKCIASWKRTCPDYEIKRWDESNFDLSQNLYASQAYAEKKWAFVSDYVRMKCLVEIGGIYMDTDVELLKPLDELLEHQAFAGFESDEYVSTGIMASEKGFPAYREFLDCYADRRFVREDGSLDMTTNVVAITNYFVERGLVQNGQYQVVDGLAVFPRDWFYPKDWETGRIELTDNSYAIHHFKGSWLPADHRIELLKRAIVLENPGMSDEEGYRRARIAYQKETGTYPGVLSRAASKLKRMLGGND